MKRSFALCLLVFALLLGLTGCGHTGSTPEPQPTEKAAIPTETPEGSAAPEETSVPEAEEETHTEEPDMKNNNKMLVQVGDRSFTVTLAENRSSEALRELLSDGPRTISCSNYGGFEKVCQLGATLPRDDVQTTTVAGDVMLYSGNQIVMFHASNSWAYTRLGTVDAEYLDELADILSGSERELTISLVD